MDCQVESDGHKSDGQCGLIPVEGIAGSSYRARGAKVSSADPGPPHGRLTGRGPLTEVQMRREG